MRRIFIHSAIAVALLSSAVANDVRSAQDRVAKREGEVAKKDEHERAELYAKLAADLADLAHEQYSAGDTDGGHKTVARIVETAEKSLQSGRMKRKKLKQAEINLRRCSRRLDEARRVLPVADQEPVKEAVSKVDKIRHDILEAMFAKK